MPVMSAWDGKERRTLPTHYQAEVLERVNHCVSQVEQCVTQLEKVVRFIEGNGQPDQGAIVRLDRLEQAKASHDRHRQWMWGSIGSIGLKALWDFLMKPR